MLTHKGAKRGVKKGTKRGKYALQEHTYDAASGELDETILKLFAEGASIIEVAVEIGVSKSWIHDQIQGPEPKLPHLAKVIRYGVTLAEAFCSKRQRDALISGNRSINHNALATYMRNRFGHGYRSSPDHLGINIKEYNSLDTRSKLNMLAVELCRGNISVKMYDSFVRSLELYKSEERIAELSEQLNRLKEA